ncbi:RNA polymerase sigma factor [Pedobacter agri]|uniref:RNA polymerase sigma factor n=1 Tax=Pedobacter agri TaxID=454586 RepID=UPI0029311DEE|nr:sigma-70 family RNA polymerase sigma factor [Pedobacter agri]
MNAMPNNNLNELLLRLQNGDYAAFEIIYNTYKKRIAANLYRLLKSWDEVEDILQELFIKIWKNRSTLQTDKKFEAYLFTIAANLVNDHFRKMAKDQKLSEELWKRLSEIYHPFDENNAIAADQELFRNIDQLPSQRKKVFVLCKIEGKSYAEVSRLLEISEAAVNDHITKANRFLKANYDKAIPFAVMMFCQNLLQ